MTAGDNQILVKCLPTFKLYKPFKLQYAISVNNNAPQTVNLDQPDDTSPEWKQNVLRGYSVGKTTHKVVIAPMTSSSKSYPTRVEVNHNKTKGWVVLDPIRTIDNQKIIYKLGILTTLEVEKVKAS